MRSVKKLRSRDIRGKSVLLRVDFNVEDVRGKILDDYRIRASLPTIQWLLRCGTKPILLSHRGRPRGKDAKHSLRTVAEHLSALLKRRVIFFESWEDLELFWRVLPERTIGMLENLRFWPEEEKNDAKFARLLAGLGDIYVNDAFGVSHRRNASVDAITRFLPSYAGLLLEKEIAMLDRVKRNRKKPFVAVFGGKKLSDKLPLIEAFLPKADAVLTGGGVANTFLAALGTEIGKSVAEKSLLKKAARIYRSSDSIFIPQDWRYSRNPAAKRGILVGSRGLSKSEAIFDIGPKTEKLYASEIARASTILWNGPMGFFENPRFAKGSYAVARSIALNSRAFSVVGGGETVAVVRKLGFENKISFVSTGGGAMLEYLAGEKLPGIEALKRAKVQIPKHK